MEINETLSQFQSPDMIICSCKGISDRMIHRLILDGHLNLEDLTAHTGAGSDCGSCVNALHVEIDRLSPKSHASSHAQAPNIQRA